MMLTSLLSNMNKNYDYTVKLKANDTGSAVLVKHNECYYLLTAAHVCDKHPREKAVVITDIVGKENEVIPTEMAISPTEEWCVIAESAVMERVFMPRRIKGNNGRRNS